MVKCRSLAAAAVGALLLVPGVSAAQSFEAAFEAAVAEAGFEVPDFAAAVAEAGFGEFEEQQETLQRSLEQERDETRRALEELREEVLAELVEGQTGAASAEPGPGDFVLENKPGGVINCHNGVCDTPAD